MQLIEKKKPSEIPAIAVSLVLAVLVGFFLDYPAYNTYKDQSNQLEQSKGQVEQLTGTSKQVDSVISKLSSEKDQLDQLSVAIPNDPSIPDLYAHLENLAKASNLNIDSVQATDLTAKPTDQGVGGSTTTVGVSGASTTDSSGQTSVSPSPTIGVISINLGLKGDYPGFTTFLGQLGRSLRLIDVYSVDISTSSDQAQGPAGASGGNITSFRLVLQAYYKK